MTMTNSTYEGGYHDSWEAFIEDFTASAYRKAHGRGEATTPGTMSIILAGQRPFLQREQTDRQAKEALRAQLAAAELARMTDRNPNATRYGVDSAALRTLGGPHLTATTAAERRAHARADRAFWRSARNTQHRDRIAADEHAPNLPMWRVLNAAKDPATTADVEAWETVLVEMRRLAGATLRTRTKHPAVPYNPAGMTPERALEIAIGVLNSSHPRPA